MVLQRVRGRWWVEESWLWRGQCYCVCAPGGVGVAAADCGRSFSSLPLLCYVFSLFSPLTSLLLLPSGGSNGKVGGSWWQCCFKWWGERPEREVIVLLLKKKPPSSVQTLPPFSVSKEPSLLQKKKIPSSVSKLPRFLPFSFSISFSLFLTSHSGYLHFKLPSPFSFKRALSRPKNPPPAAGVESSIYRLERRGLLLRVGSRGAAYCCAWGAGHAAVGRPDRGRGL